MPPDEPQFMDAVVITDDMSHPDIATHRPAGDPSVELVPGLTIERLPNDLAERFIVACEPPGEEWDGPRQFSQLYSFVRRGDVGDNYFNFDIDQLIHHALQLSRLLVPNGHSTEYAVHMLEAWVFPARAGPIIAPLRTHARTYAFHPGIGLRDWLTAADASELAALLRRFLEVRGALPSRVSSAMWWAEWTARTAFIQPANVTTVSALEALVSTNADGLRAEFVVRSLALAHELEVPDVSAELLDRFYSHRSKVIHGEFVKMDRGGPEAQDLYRIQSVLRAALTRAIEDEQFAERFTDASEIIARWPVPRNWRASVGLA